MVLREGKKRQIRHMTAAVGYPTLRLVRWAIGPLSLGKLTLGQCVPLTRARSRACVHWPDSRPAASDSAKRSGTQQTDRRKATYKSKSPDREQRNSKWQRRPARWKMIAIRRPARPSLYSRTRRRWADALYQPLSPSMARLPRARVLSAYTVAALLDYLFFDTGIMYRAVTRAMLDRQVDVNDEPGVAGLAEAIHIDLASPAPAVTDGRQCTVLLDGEDVTWSIRSPEVDRNVSVVSAYPGVRAAMTRQQRRIGRRYGTGQADRAGIIMVGRDVGTVVMPHAPVKLYMDASVEERARRRFTELLSEASPWRMPTCTETFSDGMRSTVSGTWRPYVQQTTPSSSTRPR